MKSCDNPNCQNQTLNPKFCSRSCAAQVNNLNQQRNPAKKRSCRFCGVDLTRTRRKTCEDCFSIHFGKKIKVKIPKQNNRAVYKIDLDLVLIENSTYSRSSLKPRLIEEKILANVCSECGLHTWQNKAISLHLHHINGVNNDNRLENLTLLCPNCHSQTESYCGKGKIKR